MTVIRTDSWLLDSYDIPRVEATTLEFYFNGAYASEIYDHLSLHGMYQPFKNGSKHVNSLQEKNAWGVIQEEERKLQKTWDGPNVPIFIFPSNINNRRIKRDFNGKSGLAFKDKLFLFISADNTVPELKALLTHEYNHVCRLTKFHKKEADYELLDTIILEGLAENAVRESLGEELVSTWTSYYSNEELDKMWENMVYPYRNSLKTDRKHHDVLFGLGPYPKMTGYCVGYYLVKNYLEATNVASKALLQIESTTIAQIKKTNR